jgi:hypothetical protein
MLRFAVLTAYITAAVLLLAGCLGKNAKQPPTTGIKLIDLVPVNPATRPTPVQTAAFDIYTLELPSENIASLADIWSMLYTRPVHPANPDALAANSFRLVLGESQMWQHTAAVLEQLDARATDHVRMILDFGQIDDVTIRPINDRTNISYYTPRADIDSYAAPPGRVVLKVKALPVPGARGVCNFTAVPMFVAAVPTAVGTAAAAQDKPFDDLAFGVSISPGDFLVIGPAVMPRPRESIASLFFTAAQGTYARLYVIFCGGITD